MEYWTLKLVDPDQPTNRPTDRPTLSDIELLSQLKIQKKNYYLLIFIYEQKKKIFSFPFLFHHYKKSEDKSHDVLLVFI